MSDDETFADDAASLARRVVSLIDLTDLADDRSANGLDQLADAARRFGVAAVCVWPKHVGRLRAALEGSPVRVATVADFPDPTGQRDPVIAEVRAVLDAGAHEVDLVVARDEILAGRIEEAAATVSAAAELVHDAGALLKVLLESGELDADDVRRVARGAAASGADVLKTSTGKRGPGASVLAVDAMADVVAEFVGERAIGLKPSGGIGTLDAAAAYLEVVDRRFGADWATPSTFRFGASSLLRAAAEHLD